MTSRWSALLVWGLASAAAVFWALRLLVPSPPVPANALLADSGVLMAGDLTRLLGAPPVKLADAAPVLPDAASRFRLTGVVATGSARDPDRPPAPGVAIMSIDGKPPQAFRVGDGIDQQLVLQSVGLRSARIGISGGAPAFVLELPAPAPAATGVPTGFPTSSVPPPIMPVLGLVPQSPPVNQGTPPPPMQQPPATQPGGADTQNRVQVQ